MALQQKLQQKLREKSSKKQQQEQKAVDTRLKASRVVYKFGGPWSLSEVTTKLGEYDPTTAKQAILAQLRFHRDVLKSRGDRSLFAETRRGVAYTVEELEAHLREVLAINDCDVDFEQDTGLVYQNLDEIDVESTKSAVVQRLEKARKGRQAKQAKEHLPALQRNPADLVGKQVLHQCSEDGATPFWYPAKILDIAKKNDNPFRIKFTIQYDGEDGTYNFALLSDLKNGDLILL